MTSELTLVEVTSSYSRFEFASMMLDFASMFDFAQSFRRWWLFLATESEFAAEA